ncbi:PREDICTED: SLOW GREEN 1 [Prunus dulcis]|uniref:PREDICTED: SLOW GREEN 1 n=1 Tax=Prunus dulcis TaxID=3755 RepID=A0A5E4G2S3_PRUDU|nr:PREDICTED: SLOW GREEN 1 [Prunus dulcis]
MEVRIKAHKLTEAIQVLDRLIELEPEEYEWQLLKANVHSYMGEFELATSEFKEILAKDPLLVEAYHGLLMSLFRNPPRNWRMCMLRKNEEAGKQFEKFRKLVPKNHPYKEYFNDNMFVMKLFGQKVEREIAESNI